MTLQPRSAPVAKQNPLDPEAFFRFREWACAIGTSFVSIARRLELEDARPVSFLDGVVATQYDDSRLFLTRHEDGIFLFSEGIGFSDVADRLSHPGSAYTIYLDAARLDILCCRSIAGRCVRELAVHDTFEQRGTALGNEPRIDVLDRASVLAVAAAWGPDPRALVQAAPRGMLYATRSRRRHSSL